MSKERLYKRILLIELSILLTLVLHYFVTGQRGYKAIGGEFLVIPLLYILYKGFKFLEARVIETRDYAK